MTESGAILIVDDEENILKSFQRVLGDYSVQIATSGEHAFELIKRQHFDVVISDITLPGIDGLQLLRLVRTRDLDLPVVFVTGNPAVETAAKAVEHGALRYLLKPVNARQLTEAVEQAVRMRRMATLRRDAMAATGQHALLPTEDPAELDIFFQHALSSLWMAFQPIVRWSDRTVYAHEALMRTRQSVLANPTAMLTAAERLGKVHILGRAVRAHVARTLTYDLPGLAFVNLHAHDLLDEELYDPRSPLSQLAPRVVLEVTERASLDAVRDVSERAQELRKIGFRIAIDDLGAGYAGLTTFAQLEPEVVKLDMSLIRRVNVEPTKARVIKSMGQLCGEMGLLVVAEGVETEQERDTLAGLGCDLLQGFLFGAPREVSSSR